MVSIVWEEEIKSKWLVSAPISPSFRTIIIIIEKYLYTFLVIIVSVCTALSPFVLVLDYGWSMLIIKVHFQSESFPSWMIMFKAY